MRRQVYKQIYKKVRTTCRREWADFCALKRAGAAPEVLADLRANLAARQSAALQARNSAIFIMFAYTFFKPRTGRDWRGAFSAFLVALFTEMYGFPLTIYFLSGWLQSRFPGVDWFSHDAGHLLEMMFGWKTNPHFGPFHLLSFVFIGGGFILISAAWRVLYNAQQSRTLATTGPYAYVRHPQYAGFVLVMFGFLLQWPTILTLAMFPVLVAMYVHLAHQEEKEARTEFGEAYDRYAAETPGWFPRLSGTDRTSSTRA